MLCQLLIYFSDVYLSLFDYSAIAKRRTQCSPAETKELNMSSVNVSLSLSFFLMLINLI